MSDVEEVWSGSMLLAFDGRVLEIFGFSGDQSNRFHVRNLQLDVGEPRRGRRRLTLKAATRPSGAMVFAVKDEDWPRVEALLGRVRMAIPRA